MAISIIELAPGDELQCWMRLGLALKPRMTKNGPIYQVPHRAEAAGSGDLTRFIGWVVRNNPDYQVITVQVSPFNSWRMPTRNDVPKSADIAYTAFQRVRKFSKISLPAREITASHVAGKGLKRPGSFAAFGGTDYRPYRTVEEVVLP